MTRTGMMPHDAHGHHDPHESPAVITVPIAILGVLSVVGGALNLPHWAAEHGWMHHFLSPVFEASDAAIAWPEGDPMEFITMGVTVVLALVMVGLAYNLYVKNPDKPAELAKRFGALYRGSLNKWFVDEIYDMAILRPLVLGSRQVLWAVVDVLVIDGLVNGAAKAARGLSRFNSRNLQVGQVQAYAFALAAGTAIIVFAFAVGA